MTRRPRTRAWVAFDALCWLRQEGYTRIALALRVKCSIATVFRLLTDLREHGCPVRHDRRSGLWLLDRPLTVAECAAYASCLALPGDASAALLELVEEVPAA